MRAVLTTVVTGAACLAAGFGLGVWQAPLLKTSPVGIWFYSTTAKMSGVPDNSQFESYEYPTIKWKPVALPDAPGAIVRLWTTFDGEKGAQQGTMKYKLTLFKATNKDQREVQLLDNQGFKLMQFNAADFHEIPGAPDIFESRDSVPCSEEMYKKAGDYSVK